MAFLRLFCALLAAFSGTCGDVRFLQKQHRSFVSKKCKDKKGSGYCEKLIEKGACTTKKGKKKCAATCGRCAVGKAGAAQDDVYYCARDGKSTNKCLLWYTGCRYLQCSNAYVAPTCQEAGEQYCKTWEKRDAPTPTPTP